MNEIEKAIERAEPLQRQAQESLDGFDEEISDLWKHLYPGKELPDTSADRQVRADRVTFWDTVLSALRAQREREKGCEYCKSGAFENLILIKQFGRMRIALHGGNQPIESSQKPKFCPRCGRRLKGSDED